MASINFNNPFENWFNKPQNPISPINLLSLTQSISPKQTPPNFASIFNPFKSKKPKPKPQPRNSDEPGPMRQMVDQFFWECENIPDYRHTPEVVKILNSDPIFEHKESSTPEEIRENEEFWARFRASPVVQFLGRAEEIADKINEMELKENDTPYRKEDKKLWQAVPHVIGLDGRPMVRKAIKTKKESDDKFWDFARQFFFGLWGLRQRPYPPGRPIDVAPAVGYKRLEKRYYDCNYHEEWRMVVQGSVGADPGPCELITLKTAWGGGIIDKHTFIWGDDMDEWAPIHMVYGLERAIATWEVRFGAAATAFIHKLQKGIPPWVPLKGHEKKTYKQLQQEAIESKRRDLAVLEANDGVWPGVRIPSHALFLWASGSELTTILEEDDHMPNKYIPKDVRKQLQQIIPALRPWEVLSIEKAMDQITYGGEWYCEPLGSYTTGPPYIRHWNKDVKRLFKIFSDLSNEVYRKLEETIPSFNKVMEKVQADVDARQAGRKERREAQKKAEKMDLYGRPRIP